MKNNIILSIILLGSAHQVLHAQNTYEMLLIKQDYASILEKSAVFEDTADYIFHAYALDKTGGIIEAIKTLESGLEFYPQNRSLEIALANLYFRIGHYTAAKPFLQKYRSRDEIFLKLIKTLEFNSEYNEAITLLESRLETDKMNLELMIRLADNYDAVDRFLSARNMLQKILRINPDDIRTIGKLANIYIKTEDFKDAIALCNRALELDSMNRTVLKIQGIAAFREREYKMAEENFEQLLALGDTSLVILKHLGISESKVYDFAGSSEHLQMAYEFDTTDYNICYFLGRGYLNTEEPELGIYYLDIADTLLQPSPKILSIIYVEKAMGYYLIKDYANTMKYYKLAYETAPRPDYLFYMGSLYRYQLNDPKQALYHYETFLAQLDSIEIDSTKKMPRVSISLKSTAEKGIEELKEELFFTGDLK